mmetsp:Transcript_20005/g.58451  ORF Transcript_20005/g.58451 Transcript_20005/m.58451 type:complete len:300 (+) Transcript_20005:246-1145(+)
MQAQVPHQHVAITRSCDHNVGVTRAQLGTQGFALGEHGGAGAGRSLGCRPPDKYSAFLLLWNDWMVHSDKVTEVVRRGCQPHSGARHGRAVDQSPVRSFDSVPFVRPGGSLGSCTQLGEEMFYHGTRYSKKSYQVRLIHIFLLQEGSRLPICCNTGVPDAGKAPLELRVVAKHKLDLLFLGCGFLCLHLHSPCVVICLCEGLGNETPPAHSPKVDLERSLRVLVKCHETAFFHGNLFLNTLQSCEPRVVRLHFPNLDARSEVHILLHCLLTPRGVLGFSWSRGFLLLLFASGGRRCGRR